LRKIKAPDAWGLPVSATVQHTSGKGVLICLIDPKGVDVNHPDLVAAKLNSTANGFTFNFGNNIPAPPAPPTSPGQNGSTDSHGTYCAGVVAARLNNLADGASNTNTNSTAEGIAGVANGCDLVSLRVENATWCEWASAVGYAVQLGAKVICSSMEVQIPLAYRATPDSIIAQAFSGTVPGAMGNRSVLVSASGNNNAGVVDYPASHENVIAVGASSGGGSPTDDCRCTPQDWDPTALDGSNFGDNLSIAAPGANIITTRNRMGSIQIGDISGTDYTRQNGTSIAAPHVAGVAALLIERFPFLANTPEEVITVIERTADKIQEGSTVPIDGMIQYTETNPAPGTARKRNGRWNKHLGHGRINAFRALTFADVYIRDWYMDTGAEPSAPPATLTGTSSDIVVRPIDDGMTNWHPDDETLSGYVTQNQTNYCYVKVINRGPADAQNVRITAKVWPRRTLTAADPIGRRMSLVPIQTPDITIEQLAPTTVNINDAVLERALIPLMPAGRAIIVKFRMDVGTAATAKAWAHGAADPYYDSEMGPGGPGTTRDLIIVAEVTADNDYAYNDAIKNLYTDFIIWRNNLAQRKLHFL
jgi:hypothetical protein